MSNSDYRELKPLNYIQPPYKPSWFEERLSNIGGRNLYGEPNFRVVWGMDERCYRGGRPDAIKYIGMSENDLGMPCWILEEWWSPNRLGSVEDWEAARYSWDGMNRVDMLGEFPQRGIYYMFGGRPLMDNEFKPVLLNENVLTEIARMIKDRIEATPQSQAEGWRKIQERAEMVSRARKEKSRKEAAEAWDRYCTNGERINRTHRSDYSFPATKSPQSPLFLPISTLKNRI